MTRFVLLRGGGDLATGVALRLHRSRLPLMITELKQPLCVRRTVAFAEAVYTGQTTVEGVTARLVSTPDETFDSIERGEIPVLIDPEAAILVDSRFSIQTMVDARLLKTPPPRGYIQSAALVVGLGPGFTAGVDCHAVVETQRGHNMGRVYWQGKSAPDTGQPDGDQRRVLRAPCDGILIAHKEIGEHCEPGELVAAVDNGQQRPDIRQNEIISPFKGVLRGLLHPGLRVIQGTKVGDVDPRDDPSMCHLASDKALAVGGGVLEAIFSAGLKFKV